MNSDTFTGKLLLSAIGGVSRMQCNSLQGDLNSIYSGVGRNWSVGIDEKTRWAKRYFLHIMGDRIGLELNSITALTPE